MWQAFLVAGRWQTLPTEPWVRPALWVLVALCLVPVVAWGVLPAETLAHVSGTTPLGTSLLRIDTGGFWELIYGL